MREIRHKTLSKSGLVYLMVAGTLFSAGICKTNKGLEKVLKEQITITKQIEEADKIYLEEMKNEERRNKDPIYNYINSAFNKVNPPQHISKDYVRAIVFTESTDNPNAISPAGARGYMQLMPETGKELDKESNFLKESLNPSKNINSGTKYLKWIDNYCEKRHPNWNIISGEQKRKIISAAYNGGPSRLNKRGWNIEKMPKQTRDYVKKVRKNLKKFEN